MEFRAEMRYLRVSPMKARRIVDLVRGMPAREALETLRFSPQDVSSDVYKVVASAVANAEHNARLDGSGVLLYPFGLMIAAPLVGWLTGSVPLGFATLAAGCGLPHRGPVADVRLRPQVILDRHRQEELALGKAQHRLVAAQQPQVPRRVCPGGSASHIRQLVTGHDFSVSCRSREREAVCAYLNETAPAGTAGKRDLISRLTILPPRWVQDRTPNRSVCRASSGMNVASATRRLPARPKPMPRPRKQDRRLTFLKMAKTWKQLACQRTMTSSR